MQESNKKEPYVEPTLEKRQLLSDVTEGVAVVVTSASGGGSTPS